MLTQPGERILSNRAKGAAVSVIVPLYNYARYIGAALDSVMAQTCRDIDLIVVDDASTDASLTQARDWMEAHGGADIGLFLLANNRNAGLSVSRNTGIAFAASDYCFFLDADNLLYPRCIARHLEALRARADAAAAYGLIEVMGGFGPITGGAIMGGNAFCSQALAKGNYIDAMAMLRRDVLLAQGGYHTIGKGWEDYDLWLRLCEAEQTVLQIPEILSRYRVHRTSMLRAQTSRRAHKRELRAEITRRHPWVTLG